MDPKMLNQISAKAAVAPWLAANEYSLSHKNGNRSSKRTDELNRVFIDSVVRPIFSEDKGYKIVAEHPIACTHGGKFKMDVVVYKGDKIVAMFPLKAVERSYNKNRHNYADTTVGEAYRIWGTPGLSDREGALVAAVDWIPYKVPVGNKGKYETTKPVNISSEKLTKIAGALRYPNAKHISVKIQFDYDESTNTISNIDMPTIDKLKSKLIEWEKNVK